MAVARAVARRLIEVDGVVAVVLGGSRARGAATPTSDIDLGIYYDGERPPLVEALGALAAELDDSHHPGLATRFGEWGPWVNGGAWLTIDGWPVDWLYRDLERTRTVIEDCRSGRVTCDYYPGYAHGFHNHIYMGELHTCVSLEDSSGTIRELKETVSDYPAAMRAAIVQRYLYDARFMLIVAGKSASRGDVMHMSGCLFRVAAAVAQVIYALNRRYFLNEKGAAAEIDEMPIKPAGWGVIVRALLGATGTAPEALQRSLSGAQSLVESAAELCALEGLSMTGRLPGR
jgi:hypothetical protein